MELNRKMEERSHFTMKEIAWLQHSMTLAAFYCSFGSDMWKLPAVDQAVVGYKTSFSLETPNQRHLVDP